MEDKVTILYQGNRKQNQNLNLEDKELAVAPVGSPYSSNRLLALWNSFLNLMRWSQFKRRLEKQALLASAKRNWFGVSIALLLILFFWRTGSVSEPIAAMNTPIIEQPAAALVNYEGNTRGGDKNNASNNQKPIAAKEQKSKPEKKKEQEFIPPHIADLSLTAVDKQQEYGAKANQLKQDYLARFAKVAQGEQEKYGIPASITLGLAILCSDFGTARFAEKGNNHLGITCQNNPIPASEGMLGQEVLQGNCFTQYNNAWTSFRAHSIYLDKNFKTVLKNTKKDYKAWAAALEKAGYQNLHFTEQALIKTIQNNQLYKLDK